MTLKIPSTSPHRLSAERVYRVTMALVRKLIEKGVLPPSAAQPKPTKLEEPKREPFNGVLDCRPRMAYRALRAIEGGKSETNPIAAPDVRAD
jgi:hypothetical protein